MEAIAKHDFQATAGDELSFAKGSKLKVIMTMTAIIIITMTTMTSWDYDIIDNDSYNYYYYYDNNDVMRQHYWAQSNEV